MTEKFQNKYRIPSARLPGWNYAWNASYFVTICTKNREHFFGKIENGNMHLSGAGIIADLLWYEIKNHAKNIELGAFTVMPNHMHGIIILNGDDGAHVETRHALSPTETDDPLPQNETGHALSLQTPAERRFQNQGKNTLSSIVGGYKSAVTKHANRLKFNFAWQPRFYDHIIRDEQSFHNISEYIINNPFNWTNDELNKPAT